MKKSLVAWIFACVGAVALADAVQTGNEENGWICGVAGSDVNTLEGLLKSVVNGTWTGLKDGEDGNVSVSEGNLILDLGEDDDGVAEEATFTITNKGDEAGTRRVISVEGVFAPIAKDDLLSGGAMGSRGAQVGFAVVDEGSKSAYYAWVGAAEGATALDDWKKLADVSADVEKVFVDIALDYWDWKSENVSATVAIREAIPEKDDVEVRSEALPLSGKALEKALDQKLVTSVSCMGSGTLQNLNGEWYHAVAETGGRSYATAEEAVAAALANGGTGAVTLLRAPSGWTVCRGAARLMTGGNLPKNWFSAVPAGGSEGDDPNMVYFGTSDAIDDSSEEWAKLWTRRVDNENGILFIEPTDTILKAVTVSVGEGTTARPIEVGETISTALKDFLWTHCGLAYRAADVNADALSGALAEEDATSGRKLWQSYALGVTPSAPLKLAQVEEDKDENAITLAVADAQVSKSDIKVVYAVNGSKTSTQAAGSDVKVKIPLKTGKYSVSFSFE